MIDLARIRKKSKKKSGSADDGTKSGKPGSTGASRKRRKKTQRKKGAEKKPQTLQQEGTIAQPGGDEQPEPAPNSVTPEAGPVTPEPIALPAETVDNTDLTFCLSFRIRREWCAIAIDDILEIIEVLPVTSVPNAPEEVIGIISLRGTVVAVLDLGRLLGHEPAETTEDSRIIVLKRGEEYLGLLVDGVSRTLPVDLQLLEKPPVSGESAGYVRGLFQHENRLVMLMDGERLL